MRLPQIVSGNIIMAIANVPPNAIRLFGAGATPQIQNLQFDLGAFVLSNSTK
jgi:hypothetical protein